MKEMKEITGKASRIWEKIFLYLAFFPLFLFSRRDIYWQGAAAFGASFFVLVGLAVVFLKNKNKSAVSLAALVGITGATFFYLLARKYNIFAYVDYIKLVAAFLVFIYTSLLINKYGKSFFEAVLKFLLHALFFSAVYSLFFYFLYSKDPSIFTNISLPIIQKGVVMGPFGYSNTFASFMVLGAFLAQYFSIERLEKENLWAAESSLGKFLNRYAYDFLTALFISILFITTSRFSMFIFLVLGLVYLIFLRLLKRKYKKIIFLKIVIIFVLSATLLYLFNQNNVAVMKFSQQKIQTLFNAIMGRTVDYSGGTRIYLVKFSIQQFLKDKLLGSNLGSFSFLLRQYTKAVDFEKLIDPHAFFARILMETGLFGVLTIFFPLLYLFFQKLVFTFKNRNNSNEFIIALGAIAIFVHMNVDMDFVFPITLFSLLVLLALLPGKEPRLKLKNRTIIISLGIALLLLAGIILPNFISATLLLRKDMNFPYYAPETLTVAKFLYPKNLYLDETIAENISNHIYGEAKDAEALGKAVAFYTEYSRGMKGDYLPYFNEGGLLFKLGKVQAVEQFKKAILLAPMVPETNGWYAFARTVFYNDTSEENLGYGQKSIDIAEGSYPGNLFFANYYRITGQKTKMVGELKFLKATYPLEGGPYFIEYLFYKENGDEKNMKIAKERAKARGFNVANFEQN